jgi:tryptophanyl-tRNA synthetase
MSKSSESPQGTLTLLDDPKAIAKRIRSAVTDSETEVRYDPKQKPGVSNLLEILGATSGRAIPDLEAEFAAGGYGPLKNAVADSVVEFLRPLQARYEELASDPGHVTAQLALGAEKAETMSSKVIERARKASGLLPRS